jgi:hypothetical protein
MSLYVWMMPTPAPDSMPRDPFLENAAAILETATSTPGQEEWTILIGSSGALEMVAGSDWPLESLARERAARMAFRVTHRGAVVRVEGRQGLRTCAFSSEPAGTAMQTLLTAPPMYRLA